MVNFKKMRTALNKASKNGILIGVGSVLNIIPVYGKPTITSISCHPDAHVLQSDWKKIGGDFESAIKKVK